MKTWIDISPNDWFYNEVMEATQVDLEDGAPLVAGIAYNSFQDGASYLYQEINAQAGQRVFTLDVHVDPTQDNPLYVYIDGTLTVTKSVSDNTSGTTDVELYVAPRAGAKVSFYSSGKPTLDNFGKPTPPLPARYPQYTLPDGDKYYYDPYSRFFQEYLYAFGRNLRRIQVAPDDWVVADLNYTAQKYLGYRDDAYIMSPHGVVLLPFGLNNVTCRLDYLIMENGYPRPKSIEFKATSPQVLFTNRFFPNALITRAEAVVFLDRLRRTFYSRFSDMDAPNSSFDYTFTPEDGQTIVRINGTYPVGSTGSDKLHVICNQVTMVKDYHYREVDEHTIEFLRQPLTKTDEVRVYCVRNVSANLADVGTDKAYHVEYTDEIVPLGDWWVANVLAMEDCVIESTGGQPLVSGVPITLRDDLGNAVVDSQYNPLQGSDPEERWFMPLSLLTRAEAITFLNRFRKWAVEKFKY